MKLIYFVSSRISEVFNHFSAILKITLFLKPVFNQATLVAYGLNLAALLIGIFTRFIMSETKSVGALTYSMLVSFFVTERTEKSEMRDRADRSDIKT